jgi:hypothetical protein
MKVLKLLVLFSLFSGCSSKKPPPQHLVIGTVFKVWSTHDSYYDYDNIVHVTWLFKNGSYWQQTLCGLQDYLVSGEVYEIKYHSEETSENSFICDVVDSSVHWD